MTTTPLKERVSISESILWFIAPKRFKDMAQDRGRAAFAAYWALAESDYDTDMEKVRELHEIAEAGLEVSREHAKNPKFTPTEDFRYWFNSGYIDGAISTSRELLKGMHVFFPEDGALPLG